MSRPIDISRAEAEALIDLIEGQKCGWPLDQLAEELRRKFGMATAEQQEAYRIRAALQEMMRITLEATWGRSKI